MAGGDSLLAQSIVLKAMQDLGETTAKEVAKVTERTHTNVKRSLLALYRKKYVLRNAHSRATGGQEFAYWINPNGPSDPPIPRAQRDRTRTQAIVLQAVMNAEGKEVTATEVGKATGLTRSAAGTHLRNLCDKGNVRRRRPKGTKDYLHRIGDAIPNNPLSAEERDALEWAGSGVDAAMRRAFARGRPQGGLVPLPTPTASLLSGFDKRHAAWYNGGA